MPFVASKRSAAGSTMEMTGSALMEFAIAVRACAVEKAALPAAAA